ncbi:MAG: ABC transporter permease [Verrucomicrobiae bacterium]|nr:ABC transporter permease [Verrucomicrobiae bacterium]
MLRAMAELFGERGFGADVLVSLRRILLSFGAAVVVALPLGLLMGAFAFPENLLNPLISPFRYLPAPSFVPLLLMWLGTGEMQKLALLFLGVIWFLVTLLMDNTRAVSRDLVESAQTLGANRRQALLKVVFRSALPTYVDTIRQMLAVSWTYLVIAEIVAATDGIGAMMMRAKRLVRVDEIMAGILVIGVLGLVSDAILRGVRWGCFPYARDGRK